MRKAIFLVYILSLYELSMGQNGTIDPAFGQGGYVLSSSSLTGDFFSPVPRQSFIQSNGEILIVLQANNKTKITRRSANGNVDVSYGNNGYSIAVSMNVISAAMQTDGKVVVAGVTGVPPTYFITARYNTDGTLDASFGNNGTVITHVGSADNLTSIVITNQGKIIVGGTTVLNGQGQAVLVQYTDGGLPDPTFGSNGILTDPGGPYSISSLALQQDGKILSAGSANINDIDFALARYNVDGSRDLSFNGTGLVTSNFGPGDGVHSVLIDDDGKIYAGGQTTDGSGFWRFVVARYNSDGSPDLSFNGGQGYVSPAFGNAYEVLTNMRFQSSGKIIASGTSFGSPSNDIEVIRINIDGTIDNNFGSNGNGLIVADINSGSDESDFLVIQQDDKIVTGGYSADFANPTPAYLFSCFRFNSDGSPDPDFGTAGNFTDFVPGSFYNHVALFRQPDGKLLAATEGNDNSLGINKHFISRFNENGSIDNAFGQNGTKEINFVNGLCFFQPDGKLLRTTYSNTSNGDIMLVRSNSDGTADMNFGNVGTVISGFGANEFPTSAAFQPDGKIVIGGSSRDNNGSDFLVVRYNPDGSVDESFGTSGYFKMDFENEDAIQSIAIAPDGKIVLEVSSTLFAPDFSSFDYDVIIVRLNPNGSIDLNFGDQGKLVVNKTNYDYTGVVKVQNDGKILFTHYASTDGSLQPIFLDRLNGDGSPDNSFGQNGEILCPGGIFLLQDDQKILVVGYRVNAQNNTEFTLSRFNTNGSWDFSFGINGVTTASFVQLDNYLFQTSLTGNTFFAAGGGVDENGKNVGIIAKFDLGEIQSETLACPANQIVNTDNDSCSATVTNIDPIVTPSGSVVNYTLAGATTGTGSGSVSGKTFNKGATTVTYTSSSDATKTCSFTVTVNDNQLPVINNLSVSQTTLWPPDHKLIDVTVNYITSDNCGIADTQISVSSDEPTQSREKGDQSPDWQIVDNRHIQLRAERFERGNGRMYTVKVTTTDLSGNQTTSTTTVKVPKSMDNQHPNLVVAATPNPSHNYFIVHISSDLRDKINLRLLNNNGNVVTTMTVYTALQSLRIGEGLMPGVYFLEATQSGVTKSIKLIKQ